jgi:beta-mannosidase
VRVTLTLNEQVLATYSRKVGFRHVRVNQDPHPREGNYFIIEVNRKPIFCKGGNFVPADPIFARIDRKRYEALVDRALEANFNFLRVWGGGLYESDDFYELCNERGILVWQEFIFACAKYPTTDEKFLADVKREATYQVRRLAHHASLVIWCGNNELEWHNVWGDDKGVTYPDYALFHYVLPRLLKEEDDTRYYHPSSPYSADSVHPNADHKGDQHPWDVGFKTNDWREYRKAICRFPNEGGILGATSLPTIKACLEPGQRKPWSFSWQVHENEAAFQLPTDDAFKQWLGLDIRRMSLEDYAYYGGLLQGMALSEYVKNFRRRMFDSASAIFWMYNDCWPMVRSWTIVDYYLRRTPSFHPVRRAFAPLTVVLAVEEGKVQVFGVNEGPAAEVEVRYGLCALAGGYPLDKMRKIRLPANAANLVATFEQSKWEKLGDKDHAAFAILKRDGAELARDVLLLPFYKDMSWPRPKISVKRERGKAIFRSDTFAFRVCLDLDGTKALPDNFFDLLPGENYVLRWPESLGKPEVKRVWQSPAGKVGTP